MSRFIPGGRGRQRGPDALSTDQQLLDERVQRVPPADGWLVATGPLSPNGTPNVGTNVARFMRLERIDRTHVLVRAMLRVTTLGAGIATTALYRYDKQSLYQMPNSVATFDVSATGLKTCDLQAATILQGGNQYWLGLHTTASANFSGSTGYLTKIHNVTTGTLPTIVQLTSSTGTTNLGAPLVIYLSTEAVKVL